MAWQITGAPSTQVEGWVREVEHALPPEDTARIDIIEFHRSEDMDGGAGGLSNPTTNPRFIKLNLSITGSKKGVQATLAHEVGHHVDFRITEWKWHQFAGEGHLAGEDRLNEVTDYVMWQMAEFFASGYAIKHGFMIREDEILFWMPQHAPHIRKILTGQPSPFE